MKVGVGVMLTDSMISSDFPALVTRNRLVAAFEFDWTVPKLIAVGATNRLLSEVPEPGVVVLTALHPVSREVTAEVDNNSRNAKKEKEDFAISFPGENFIFGPPKFLGFVVKPTQ